MSYCINCGAKIGDDVKYCPECGSENSKHTDKGRRKQEFAGKIIKCPNCGETLESFVSKCPSCAYELRGVDASEKIRDFSFRLEQAENDGKKIEIIGSYPIPNNKEDIFEFMILASTKIETLQNSGSAAVNEIGDAWLAKLEQGYQKAKLLFDEDADFRKIQDIYEKAHNEISRSNKAKKTASITSTLLRTSILWCGIVLFAIAFIMDAVSRSNTSMFYFGGMLVMIAGSFIIGKKSTKLTDTGVGVLCGVISLILGIMLHTIFNKNGTIMELSGGVSLVIIVIMHVKSMNKKD